MGKLTHDINTKSKSEIFNKAKTVKSAWEVAIRECHVNSKVYPHIQFKAKSGSRHKNLEKQN
jgi:hypothetical protein